MRRKDRREIILTKKKKQRGWKNIKKRRRNRRNWGKDLRKYIKKNEYKMYTYCHCRIWNEGLKKRKKEKNRDEIKERGEKRKEATESDLYDSFRRDKFDDEGKVEK